MVMGSYKVLYGNLYCSIRYQRCPHCAVISSGYRLVGLEVKASALRAAELGSIPTFAVDVFRIESYQ